MVELSKKEAAAQQIDGAISHFFSGETVCAVTLAGAAEASMPEPDSSAGFVLGKVRSDGPEKTTMSERKIVSELNDV